MGELGLEDGIEGDFHLEPIAAGMDEPSQTALCLAHIRYQIMPSPRCRDAPPGTDREVRANNDSNSYRRNSQNQKVIRTKISLTFVFVDEVMEIHFVAGREVWRGARWCFGASAASLLPPIKKLSLCSATKPKLCQDIRAILTTWRLTDSGTRFGFAAPASQEVR